MKAVKEYRTLESLSEGIYKEKGSKFIAYAVPCYSEEEVKNFLSEWRKTHHQARHVCYAYRLGADKKIYRANDDGEPNNSAGVPILGQIQSFDLTNVLVGVVRYFGGTKLGVGGLIQAYKTAAREALEQAIILERELKEEFELHFRYDQLPVVMSMIKANGFTVLSTDFNSDCILVLEAKLDKKDVLMKGIDNVEIISKGIR